MITNRIAPTFTNFYSWNEGENFVKFWRTRNAHGGPAIYEDTFYFKTAEEAQKYFENV